MLLRASGEHDGARLEVDAVVDGGDVDGVRNASILLAYAEAIVRREPLMRARTRAQVIEQMGVDALVDAAAVASNFERMVRIADATGITLGERLREPTAEARRDLALDRFAERSG